MAVAFKEYKSKSESNLQMAFELKRCGPVGGRSAGNTGRLMKGTTFSVQEKKQQVIYK